MARILIVPLPQYGHVLPTFPLARALHDRGHQVVYATMPNMHAAIVARGFQCLPLFGDIAAQGQWLSGGADRVSLLLHRRHDELLNGTTEALLRSVDPQLALVDILIPDLLFLLHGLGIPALRCSTSLSLRIDELPPITSGVSVGAPAIELEVVRATARLQSTAPDFVRAFGEWPAVFESLCTRFAYPEEEISFDQALTARIRKFEEIILCPAALDYERVRDKGPLHCALPVELDRIESVADEVAAFVTEAPVLIYVSLGSLPERYPDSLALFKATLAVMSKQVEWRAVISVGDFASHPDLAQRPSNVLVVRHAPQLWLLRRAAVFVTHAGLGSVREAVALHVPMLAVPQQFDQAGNAARVEHHRLGLRILTESSPAPIGAKTLGRKLASVLHDRESYRARLKAKDEAVRREEAQGRGIQAIEASLSTAPRLRPPSTPPASAAPNPPFVGWAFVDARGELLEGRNARPGETLELRDGEALTSGKSGFTICSELGDALLRAKGGVLGRFELSGPVHREGPYLIGPRLRCAWLLDVSALLHRYAEWCSELALEAERQSDPETLEFFELLIEKQRARAALEVPRADLEAAWREACKFGTALWYRGYLAAAYATRSDPHDAARGARWHAIRLLSLRAAPATTGATERAAAYEKGRAVTTARVDAELLQRVLARISEAGLAADG